MSRMDELFATRVPRYTSYPTAPHFHAGIGEDDYRRWLGALSFETPLSLYVHIPFCDTLCWFCACHTTVINSYSPMRGYLELLLREIDLVAAHVPQGPRVTHLHWGGGSPTLMQANDVLKLNAALRSTFAFDRHAEFAAEIDPRGFGESAADALAEAGLTRASVGVQDFDPAVQWAINRIQSREETANAVALLRARHVSSLNIDLIYGLPHQTVEGLRKTIDFVLSLTPDRLAIFGYAHVPHFKKHQALIPEAALPGVAERFAQAEAARAQLEAAGYETWIHEIVRRKILKDQDAFTQRSFVEPESVKSDLLGAVRAYLGPDYDMTHFTPRYRPWRQRIAFVPDGDIFKGIASGKASVVTDEIEAFTEDRILLASGQTLPADIVITATGFNLSVLGDISFRVDDKPVDFAQTVTYRGMMFTGVPNMAWIFGYFRASWTLRVDIIADFVCRLLNHMKAIGKQEVSVSPRPEDSGMELLPWLDPENFNPGYMLRSMHLLPKRGSKDEWQHTQDYWTERKVFPTIDLDEPVFQYR